MSDYIKREDIIKLLYNNENCGACSNMSIMSDIRALPSADVVERKRGEWIDGANHNGYVRCSMCGYNEFRTDRCDYLNFCPNCGADMRKE